MSVYCGISKIEIREGQGACLIPLRKNPSERGGYIPAALPIFGEYDETEGLVDIENDQNTKLLESYFGANIKKIVKYLVDGAKSVNWSCSKILKDELYSWEFTWMDAQIYRTLTNHYSTNSDWSRYMGDPKFLEHLGFTLLNSENDYKTYRKDSLVVISDGDSIRTTSGESIYSIDRLEKLVDIPAWLNYLKNTPVHEAWSLFELSKQKDMLGMPFDTNDHKLNVESFLSKKAKESGMELHDYMSFNLGISSKINSYDKFCSRYFENLDIFGDDIAKLKNVCINLYPMSTLWEKYVPHLAYNGGRSWHQVLLEKFAEINKSYE